MQVLELLDRAAAKTGSDSATARALGPKVTPQRVNDWRHGRRGCTWNYQFRLCQIAELSPGETLRHLEELAGKAATSTAVGVLVMLSFGSFGTVPPAGSHGDRTATMYIMSTYRFLMG
jgi:hypothetical protein